MPARDDVRPPTLNCDCDLTWNKIVQPYIHLADEQSMFVLGAPEYWLIEPAQKH